MGYCWSSTASTVETIERQRPYSGGGGDRDGGDDGVRCNWEAVITFRVRVRTRVRAAICSLLYLRIEGSPPRRDFAVFGETQQNATRAKTLCRTGHIVVTWLAAKYTRARAPQSNRSRLLQDCQSEPVLLTLPLKIIATKWLSPASPCE